MVSRRNGNAKLCSVSSLQAHSHESQRCNNATPTTPGAAAVSETGLAAAPRRPALKAATACAASLAGSGSCTRGTATQAKAQPPRAQHLVNGHGLGSGAAPAGAGGRDGGSRLRGRREVDLVVGGPAQAERGRVVRVRRFLLLRVVPQVVDLGAHTALGQDCGCEVSSSNPLTRMAPLGRACTLHSSPPHHPAQLTAEGAPEQS